MPGKKQSGKKNVRKSRTQTGLELPKDNQQIAIVEATHGGYPAHFGCRTINDDLIIAPIRGSMSRGPKRVIVKKEDYVLLDLMDCTSRDSWYINHVYTKDDIKQLNKLGLLDAKEKSAADTKETQVVFGTGPACEGNADKTADEDEMDIDDI